MKRYYPLIVAEGATVMAVELCSAKILAPHFGSSLFVWAAVLAVTLGALASGYLYGSRLSLKPDINGLARNSVYGIIISVSVLPFISIFVLPVLIYLEFKLAILIASVITITFPIFLLGTLTPLIIQMNMTEKHEGGSVSGKVYGISTIGGIVSTLLCGFFFLPSFGLNHTLYFFAFLLLISMVRSLGFQTRDIIIGMTVLVLFATSIVITKRTNIYESDGILGKLEVVDVTEQGVVIRRMLVNDIIQTEVEKETHTSRLQYIHLIDSVLDNEATFPKHTLLLGLGGGSVANLIAGKGSDVDAVELDGRIAELATTYFGLSEYVKVFIMDARAFINRSSKKYDLIIMDLFKGEEQPSHTLTLESFDKIRTLLNDKGQLILNWHGYIDGELGEGSRILINTLHAAGFSTKMLFTGLDEDYRNTILVCHGNEGPEEPAVASEINRDDKPIIELANARANKQWRINYIEYYRRR